MRRHAQHIVALSSAIGCSYRTARKATDPLERRFNIDLPDEVQIIHTPSNASTEKHISKAAIAVVCAL